MKKKKIFLIVIFVLLMISAFLLFPFADNTEPKQDVKNLYLNQFQIDGETDIYYDNQEVLEVQFAGETIWRAGSEVTFNLDNGNTQTIYYDYAKSVFEKAPQPQKEGWEFIGWKLDSSASPDDILTTYTADSTDFNMYAVFRKLITVTFYNNSTTPTVLTDYAYYNNGNIDNPEFTLQPLQRDGWTLQGISESTNKANISTIYNDITLEQNTTYYGIYTKPLNLVYNASNGTNNSITKNYEVLYYSTGYDYNGIKLCTANDVNFKDSLGNAVCVWQESSTGNTYDLGIDCPSEFCTSNASNYTFNALYGSVVTYVTKIGTFANSSNTMEKVVIYGNDIGVLNADEQPTASGYVYDGVTWSGNTNIISNFKADGKPYTVYVRLKQYHHHTTSGNIHANDNASSSGGLSNNYSAPSSGGCFTTANYHRHSSGGGSLTSGTHLADNAIYSSAGGCYTKISTAPGTCNVTWHVNGAGNVNTYITCRNCKKGFQGSAAYLHHENCGASNEGDFVYGTCPDCGTFNGNSGSGYTHSYNKTAYTRSCGKSTSTIEYYSRSCGLTEGQVLYTYSWE